MAAEFVVIGAGQFGRAVAVNLTRQGHSVLIIDDDPSRIQDLASEVDAAVHADATEETTLRELGVDRMGVAVVAIGANALEASIMTTALLRQLGVPRIVARSVNPLHARVLRAVGAQEVVDPEEEMGRRLAMRLLEPGIREQLTFGNATLVEIDAPPRFFGHTLRTIDVRNRYGVSVLAIRRGERMLANPRADEVVTEGDVLVLLGAPESIHEMAAQV